MTLAIRHNVLLSAYTTLKIGGPAKYFVTVSSVAELKAAVYFAQQNKLPLFVLGGGSNVQAPDAGFTGLVVHLAILGITHDMMTDSEHVVVTAGAGEGLDALILQTVESGWWGLENLSHIPGTVGATPVQNVGAYGVTIGEYITAVTVYNTQTNQTEILTQAECGFGYRDSIFKHQAGQQYIIVSVTISLSLHPQPRIDYPDLTHHFATQTPTLAAIRDAIIAIRSAKFPDWTKVGTAGSFFKNPIVVRAVGLQLQTTYPNLPLYEVDDNHVKVALGFILDKICGLKGYTDKNVCLYEQQALVLVAASGATSDEVDQFVQKISDVVFAKTKIHIEREVVQLK